MAKDKSIYTCTDCGATRPKWLGKCPGCGAWNTLTESVAESPSKHRYQSLAAAQPVTTLSEIEATDVDRQPTGIDELDRVLGGGIVAGGVVLIGGDPGIGKSTLLLQALDALAQTVPTLYVTGEESGAQVALRARRLGLDGSRVRVVSGRVWITQRNDLVDHFLHHGQCFELRRGHGLLIGAEQDVWLRFESDASLRSWLSGVWRRLTRRATRAATVLG